MQESPVEPITSTEQERTIEALRFQEGKLSRLIEETKVKRSQHQRTVSVLESEVKRVENILKQISSLAETIDVLEHDAVFIKNRQRVSVLKRQMKGVRFSVDVKKGEELSELEDAIKDHQKHIDEATHQMYESDNTFPKVGTDTRFTEDTLAEMRTELATAQEEYRVLDERLEILKAKKAEVRRERYYQKQPRSSDAYLEEHRARLVSLQDQQKKLAAELVLAHEESLAFPDVDPRIEREIQTMRYEVEGLCGVQKTEKREPDLLKFVSELTKTTQELLTWLKQEETVLTQGPLSSIQNFLAPARQMKLKEIRVEMKKQQSLLEEYIDVTMRCDIVMKEKMDQAAFGKMAKARLHSATRDVENGDHAIKILQNTIRGIPEKTAEETRAADEETEREERNALAKHWATLLGGGDLN